VTKKTQDPVAKQKATLKRNNEIRRKAMEYAGRMIHAAIDDYQLGRDDGRYCKNASPTFNAAVIRLRTHMEVLRGNLTQAQFDHAVHRRAVGQAFLLAARLVEDALAGQRTLTDGVPSAFMLQVHRVLVLANAKGAVRTVREPWPSWLDFDRPGSRL
jgi:hypothetical protein